MSRVAVTGAGGFLGRHLCRRLAGMGWEVLALPHSRVDVTDYALLSEAASEVDAVVHLAFPTRRAERRERPAAALQAVLRGTANVLRLAAEHGASQVVLASSGKVYGPPERLPVDEDHPGAPSTQLGALKHLAEAVLQCGLQALGCASTVGVTTLRLFNAYGAGQRDDFVVPHLLAAARSGGPVTLGELDHGRDYVHVDDCVAAFVTALEQPGPAGRLRALNVGTGRATTVRDLVARLSQLSGHDLQVVVADDLKRPGEPAEERADVGRLTALGWRPAVSLDRGLARLWASEQQRS